jgi:putative hydrolase of the HAD superfamily
MAVTSPIFRPRLPRAMLIDMDDTIISAYSKPEAAWLAVASEFKDEIPLTPQELATTITTAGRAFWMTAGPEWRLKLREARHVVVAKGFEMLRDAGRPTPPDEMIVILGNRFDAYREEQMYVFPDAHAAIDEFKARGIKLALVTNGPGDIQRPKIERFALQHRFDHIQIEGEHGFGKPDDQAYLHALQMLGVSAEETWMIGDNLEWEVVAPQRLGIYAIWMDVHGDGLPEGSTIKPDRVIRKLSDLLES